VWHTPWFVLFFKKNSTKKVAFVASKKVGNAVSRNRAKRLLRALFINFSDQLISGNYIFVAKPPIIQEKYQKLSKEMAKVLKKSQLCAYSRDL